jgi:hypothetical protein
MTYNWQILVGEMSLQKGLPEVEPELVAVAIAQELSLQSIDQI